MEHEPFPVAGFEFMNEPATLEQKEIIVELAGKCGTPIDPNGTWPEPFSKHDAYRMIKVLRAKLGLPSEA